MTGKMFLRSQDNAINPDMDGSYNYGLGLTGRPGVIGWIRLRPVHADMLRDELAHGEESADDLETRIRLNTLEMVEGWINSLEFEGDEDVARRVILDLVQRVRASGAL